jgi:DNA-binding FadR family transcriptional regulator
LHRLEANGLVEIRQGGATRVNDFLVTAGLQILPLLISTGGRLDPRLLRDLMEIRVMLLGWTARAVARVAVTDPSHLVRSNLESIVSALEQPDRPAEELQLLDFEFFTEMMQLTGNRLLGLILGPLRQVYLENTTLFVPLYHRDHFDPTHHRQALTAMWAGDADRAGALMEAYASTAVGVFKDEQDEQDEQDVQDGQGEGRR